MVFLVIFLLVDNLFWEMEVFEISSFGLLVEYWLRYFNRYWSNFFLVINLLIKVIDVELLLLLLVGIFCNLLEFCFWFFLVVIIIVWVLLLLWGFIGEFCNMWMIKLSSWRSYVLLFSLLVFILLGVEVRVFVEGRRLMFFLWVRWFKESFVVVFVSCIIILGFIWCYIVFVFFVNKLIIGFICRIVCLLVSL